MQVVTLFHVGDQQTLLRGLRGFCWLESSEDPLEYYFNMIRSYHQYP